MTHHITDEQIRAVFLANGFTIKDGHTDLKPYVYAAARAALALAAQQAVPMTDTERADMICAVAAICTGTSSRNLAATAIEWTELRYGITTLAAPAPAPAPAVPSDERAVNAMARAFALATMAAEEFIRCNGLATGEADEFAMTGPDLTDEHAMACIDHLKWVGECVAFDCDDGVIVRLGDFTLGSLS